MQNLPGIARMPALFIGHGSPMNALEINRYTDTWRHIGASIAKPKSILCVSAHWETRGTAVTAMDKPRTIHDFGGFPQALFDVQYPAPGSSSLAAHVRDLLAPVDVQLNQSWGLDHGVWSVLTHLFPGADVPVVQLSLDSTLDPSAHYALATRLKPLRDEGILIVGSGNVVHNLGEIQWADDAKPQNWAKRFNENVRAHLVAHRHQPLIDFNSLGDDARLSVPTSEHYLPLLYVIATRHTDEVVSLPIDGIEFGSISMLTVTVGIHKD
jgi:4,5-DOPA dioxygenase extradiol